MERADTYSEAAARGEGPPDASVLASGSNPSQRATRGSLPHHASRGSNLPHRAWRGTNLPHRAWRGTNLPHRAWRGAWALGVRQVIVQLVSAGAAIVLARVLGPAEFGIYAVTLFLMHVLVVAGDAGLAAALVREEEEPADQDFEAVFTFQQVATTVVAVAGVGAILLDPAFALRTAGFAVPLLPAALVALVLTSFTTTPIAKLERHLRFDELAKIEVAQALAFNGVAVAGAVAGLGAASMGAALLARSLAGVVLVRLIEPWPRRHRWDWPRVRSRLRFGMAYQATTAVNLVREAIVPVYIGATLGSAAVGGVFFAQLLAMHALVVVYMLQRVLMPLFARYQSSREGLARAVESSLFTVAAVVVPVQTTVLALEEPLVRIVFGEQWLAMLPVFRWLWVSALLEPQLVVAIALMNALGHSPRTLKMTATTTALGWIAGVPLLLLLGPVGFGVASVLLLGVKWGLVRDADDVAGFASTAVVVPVWMAGALSAAVTWLAAWRWPADGVGDLVILTVIAVVVYGAALALLSASRAAAAIAWLRSEAADAEPMP